MKNNEYTDKKRLEHILGAADFILKHFLNKTEDDFYRDDLLKYAALKQIEIIGEAANYLSKNVTEKYDKVEWRRMINARHLYVHHYNGVDWTSVWDIVQENIPTLKSDIEKIIKELNF